MIQYAICLFVIFLFFTLLTTEIFRQYKSIPNAWVRVGFCLILTLLYKVSFGNIFCGLEYEDSYVFSFCAKQFNHGIYPTSFLIDGVSIGSLDTPFEMSTYGGHFITYPAYLSIFTKLFGWSFTVVSIANSVVTFYVLLLLSSFKKGSSSSWLIAPLVYCMAPIMNVFSNTFLAETFSSLICLVFILSYYNYKDSKDPRKYALTYISFFLAIITKRENTVLLIIPSISAINSIIQSPKINPVNITNILKPIAQDILPFISITLLYLLIVHNIFSTETTEAVDISRSTFSIDYFIKLFPCFVKAFFTFSYFSVALWILIVICFMQFFHKTRNDKVVPICILFFLYLGLYTFHYRGYFFIKYDELSSFDSFRYINNFYYLIPLALCYIDIRGKIILPFILIFSGISFWYTSKEREYFSDIENEERFAKAKMVSDYLNSLDEKTILLTENILIYQNISDTGQNHCNIGSYGNLMHAVKSLKIERIFIDVNNIAYIKDRYDIDLVLEKCKQVELTDNARYFKIYEIDFK